MLGAVMILPGKEQECDFDAVDHGRLYLVVDLWIHPNRFQSVSGFHADSTVSGRW